MIDEVLEGDDAVLGFDGAILVARTPTGGLTVITARPGTVKLSAGGTPDAPRPVVLTISCGGAEIMQSGGARADLGMTVTPAMTRILRTLFGSKKRARVWAKEAFRKHKPVGKGI